MVPSRSKALKAINSNDDQPPSALDTILATTWAQLVRGAERRAEPTERLARACRATKRSLGQQPNLRAPAVDAKHLTGDPAQALRQQEMTGGTDIIGLTDALEGVALGSREGTQVRPPGGGEHTLIDGYGPVLTAVIGSDTGAQACRQVAVLSV